MSNTASDETHAYELRISQEFQEGLSWVHSPRVLAQIRNLLNLLPDYPNIGSPNVRECLTKLYGPNLRKLPVSTFVIIYRVGDGVVDLLALVYAPRVR